MPSPLTLARRNNTQAVGKAVLDVQVVDVHARNVAAIQAKLERGPPSPVVIVAAAADEIAVLHDGRSAEIVINVLLRIRRRKGCAEEDGAAGRDVSKPAVLDAIALTPIEGRAVRQKWQLAGAVADNIEAGRKFLWRVRRRPEGETIVARVARGTILDDRVAHADAEIYSVGDGVAEAATVHDEVAGVIDPDAGSWCVRPRCA